ncbi:MAG: hypothetical protein ABIL05_01075 [candidate division WOR-3 bacterium]
MEILDRLTGINGYAVIKGEDGSLIEQQGASSAPLGDLVAFFSSAGEVIKNTMGLGSLHLISLKYQDHQLLIFENEGNYIGVEVAETLPPVETVKEICSHLKAAEKPKKFEIPRGLKSKIVQINLLLDEFSTGDNKEHWIDNLKAGLEALAGDLAPFVGIINGNFDFKDAPPEEREAEFTSTLRMLIDFLVKKAVEEFGSTQARIKVQSVIEKMK